MTIDLMFPQGWRLNLTDEEVGALTIGETCIVRFTHDDHPDLWASVLITVQEPNESGQPTFDINTLLDGHPDLVKAWDTYKGVDS